MTNTETAATFPADTRSNFPLVAKRSVARILSKDTSVFPTAPSLAVRVVAG